MNTCSRSLMAIAGVSAAASVAHAFTVATFADPAFDGSTPLFRFDSGTNLLTGGWSGSNLTLQTPGLPAPNFNNAQFTMTNVACVFLVAQQYTTGPGTINFLDSSSALLMTMTFTGGLLNTGSFGSSDFIGHNVVFSGPIVPFPLFDEAFAFSFANPVSVSPPGSFTVTASFTSSAIPAPGAAALLGLGGLVALRRRR